MMGDNDDPFSTCTVQNRTIVVEISLAYSKVFSKIVCNKEKFVYY